ncbi:MAG: penicillin-binding protein, partial [Myxococcales bacterium]|nr:penicillin-binding protein [Myxococcales bacterium]
MRSLDDYAPPQATVVYGAEGEVVARFAKERRTVVSYEKIPRVMVNAVVAAEDSDFFRHRGIDFFGIARCAVKNLVSGRKRCGGSTITQQTAKTFFLNPEKTYVRKLKEAVLAKRIEDALAKEDILYLYLNQIYFGHGAYGIQEASRVYFGVDVWDLRLEQAALLAGLPKSPAHLDPYKNPDGALERRSYVLERLEEMGEIDADARDRAARAPLELAWDSADRDLDSNNHFAATVREWLVERFGEEATETGGLSVYTGLDPEVQRAAETALADGLRALDKRQGFRGPIVTMERNQVDSFLRILSDRRAKPNEPDQGDEAAGGPLVFDLRRLERVDRSVPPDEWTALARFRRLEPTDIVAGVVVQVDDGVKEAVVDLGGARVRFRFGPGDGV